MFCVIAILLQGIDIFAIVAFVIVVFYLFYRLIVFRESGKRRELDHLLRERTEELLKERVKAQSRTAIDSAVPEEQRRSGYVQARKYRMVTVLFYDVRCTSQADGTVASTIIDTLDWLHYQFDAVVKKHGVRKVKTVGDTFVCVAGVSDRNHTDPVKMVLVALELMQIVNDQNRNSPSPENVVELRIGIDTGSVVMGIAEETMLYNSIWGSTVNTASRLQVAGGVGGVNISENTYLLVNTFFKCEYQCTIPIKNKGDVKIYLVQGILSHLSDDSRCILPNKIFSEEMQLFRLADLEDFVLGKLERELPGNLYYHNLKHTIDVYTQVELMGRSENITREEMLLLRTAALLHDTGHLVDYANHEAMSVKFAQEILPKYGYSDNQIARIAELIMATKLPPKPSNLLEQIICDADLDYLGRSDFIPVSNLLYMELHEMGMVDSIQEWNQKQVKFIEAHQYFTQTAINQRDVNKSTQLENIKLWIEKMKDEIN